MTTLDDLVKQSELVQRHMDTISNLLHLAAVTKNINQFGAIKIVMEYESRQMSRDSDRLNQMMNEYRNQVASESQEEKKDNMKRNVIITLALLVLMFVLVSGIPAVAQSDVPLATNTPSEVIAPVVATLDGQPVEATQVAPGDEQPPVVVVENPQSTAMFWVFSAVIFGLLAVIVLVLRPLIVQLGTSAPSWAVDAAFSAGGTLLKSAQDYASTTPSQFDDDLVAELRKEVDSLREQIKRMTAAPVAKTNPDPLRGMFTARDGDDDGGLG